MRKPIDAFRVVLAAVLGAAASVGAAYLLAVYAHATWLDPAAFALRVRHARLLDASWLVPLAALPLGLAWVYATWFDGLLRGPAPLRGLKFSVMVWLWVATIVLLVRQAGVGGLGTRTALEWGTGLLALLGAFGIAAGVAYGAGRRYDEYRCGIGYGVPDRCSLA